MPEKSYWKNNLSGLKSCWGIYGVVTHMALKVFSAFYAIMVYSEQPFFSLFCKEHVTYTPLVKLEVKLSSVIQI